MTSYVAPSLLTDAGPYRFTRQTERLLGQLGFTDIVNIDGSGDHGGDILATRRAKLWVFQAKWKSRQAVGAEAVDEAANAQDHYGTDRAVVVTNTRLSPEAHRRIDELGRIGKDIKPWDGALLQELYAGAPEHPALLLRDYQDDAVSALWSDLQGRQRALLILATGLGKTVVGGEVIGRFLRGRPDQDVLVVAHTKDLVNQLERALWRHLPKAVKTQVLTGDDKPRDLRGVTCATVASALDAVLRGWRPGLVMIDETHHVGEDGLFDRLLTELSDAQQFGVTATPWRSDQYDIEQRFGSPSYKLGIEEGMRRGYLAAVDYRLFVDNIDWDVVRQASENRYSLKELNSKLFLVQRDDSVLEALSDVWRAVANPRGIIFCQSIQHCEHMEQLVRRSPDWRNASAVHAKMSKRERQQRLLDFRSGRIPLLIAVDILNEGVDVPDVNILAFTRVTHSRRIFVQQLGRGLRLRAGKDRVVALDFVSDIRRVAALLNIRRRLENGGDVEVLSRVPQTRIEFNDVRAESLLEQWILDAADLETANDEARLQFLDPDILPA